MCDCYVTFLRTVLFYEAEAGRMGKRSLGRVSRYGLVVKEAHDTGFDCFRLLPFAAVAV